ncbi:MAG: exo-alpha-sialidase [Verrucomicrobia bacterium]|nr:exo-alpha-sialidase [Verrucomicrobiota bacterium]
MRKPYRPVLSVMLLAALLRAGAAVAADPEFFTVFRARPDGYKSIRIPSVVVTRQGVVLAFAEGRAADADQAGNSIILKRSRDGGRTWLPLALIADDGANSLNNPTAVVEQESGRVFLMYQRIPAHMKERDNTVEPGYEGTNVYHNFITWSDDEGASWSPPLDITRTTKRPTGATTIASGPGIGVQLTRGPHQGRLLIPFNEGPYHQWNNYAVFSDDRGRNWQWGRDVPGAFVADTKLGRRSQINEVQMVELSDGSVRLNSRSFAGAKVRKTAVSADGGATWSPVADVPTLRDPSCNASILRYSFDDARGRGRILYSGPDSPRRNHGTVYLSVDDGATWPVKRVLWPGGFAYSVLTRLPDGTVGCLFEPDDAERILFARFPITWLAPVAAAVPATRASPPAPP